ncbi:enhancer of mRNA-decapping protein 4-like [Aricia agestis]|uniref:enhancer of mRNA-decapping protein 4-like n=1 Tax=Aricia agestis TaxID=91739 RepID=UPI001C207514|nr:enhancer of mRNA-decapping protein 4-like [Aricia agestis]XP_041978034.1 enhancer of mRNA-decapping protein 4-like [Aricia agestis]
MDLKRWKSVDTVDFTPKFIGEDESFYFADHRSHSESSLEPCVVVYSEASSPSAVVFSEASSPCAVVDHGSDASLAEDNELHLEGKLINVERKIDELNRLLQEQLVLVGGLRRELASVTSRRPPAADIHDADLQSLEVLARLLEAGRAGGGAEGADARARCLLDAIELKHLQRIDFQIKDSICKFLQSDDLKAQLASATAESLQPVVRSCLSETFSRALQPALDAAYRRLLKLVTGVLSSAFQQLEANSAGIVKWSGRWSRGLRAALHKHHALLDAQPRDLHHLQTILEEVLQNELKEWRGKLFDVLMSEMRVSAGGAGDARGGGEHAAAPDSVAPPAAPPSSAVNKLMKSAVIKKHIEDGNINASFEEALSSGDLALVVAACRGAEPARVFGPPCRLRQPVLLSLVQQLVTDMVHDTHLKCRYLEEAITRLDAWEPGTRAHLPLVVREVRTHLTRFLQAYPGHVAATRITLIIMAANNLIR